MKKEKINMVAKLQYDFSHYGKRGEIIAATAKTNPHKIAEWQKRIEALYPGGFIGFEFYKNDTR